MVLQDAYHSVKSFTIMQNISDTIPAIFETHKLALKSVHAYQKKRFGFETLQASPRKHFIGIVGPRRGKGKGRSQFKGIDVKNKFIFSDHLKPEILHFPLYLCGFLV